MKTIHLCLLSLFAWSAAADFQPITEFPEGEYLGRGRYIAQDGRTEYYGSQANFYADAWVLNYIAPIGASYYELNFEFADTGFFQFEMFRTTPTPDAGVYYGHGFCGSNQCHLYADMGANGWVEEAITFHPANNKVYRLGSMHTTDAKGQTQVIAWEEEMIQINQ